MAFRSAATYRLTAAPEDSTVGGKIPSKYLVVQYSSSCAGSARRIRRERAVRVAVLVSRLSATISRPFLGWAPYGLAALLVASFALRCGLIWRGGYEFWHDEIRFNYSLNGSPPLA